MKDSGSILPVLEPGETPRSVACHPFQIDVLVATDGSLNLVIGGTTIQVQDGQNVYTGECPQIAVTVKFPGVGGTIKVYDGTNVTTTIDSDGDGLITFERGSPSTFDVEAEYQAKGTRTSEPKPGTSLAPKPVVPSRRVKLVPKIGYPPPDKEDR